MKVRPGRGSVRRDGPAGISVSGKPIRDHVLPLIAETMIQGGEINSGRAPAGAAQGRSALAYARALMRQAEGDTAQALTLLDAIANGHDQFDRARAAIRAVELRLAAQEIDKAQAADALDKLLFAWRGDARELALRERVAELRGQTGAWRVALSTLRQAETDFPDQATPIRQRLKDMFRGDDARSGRAARCRRSISSPWSRKTPTCADADDDEAVEQALADRLLALDLPEPREAGAGEADAVRRSRIRRKRASAPAWPRWTRARATMPPRYAVLDASRRPVPADLPADLTEQRLILRAGSVARHGDPAGAAALLATRT